MREFARPFARSFARPLALGGSLISAWSPAELFANGENGGWWEPSDLTSLRVATTGKTDIPGHGNPAGVIFDKRFAGDQSFDDYLQSLNSSTFSFSNAAGVSNFGGSIGTWNVETRTFASTGTGSNTGYPRLTFTNVLETGKWYKIKVSVTGDAASLGSLRLSLSGNVNRVNIVDGEADAVVLAASDHLQFIADGTTSPFSVQFQTLSVQEVPGNHLVAPNDAARPTLTIADNKPYLKFDGAEDEFAGAISGLSASTSIVTAARSRAGKSQYSIHAGSASQFILAARQNKNSASNIGAGSPTHRLNGAGVNWANNRGLVWSALDGQLYVVTSEAVNAATWPAFGISNDQAASYRMASDWYGSIVLDRAFTGGERANVEQYLADKAGVTLA